MLRTAIISAALLGTACAALASTDCASTVATLTVQAGKGAGYIVVLSSGVSFAMSPSSGGYREILAVTGSALNLSSGITARFAADGVDCSRAARRTDLIAIVLGRDEAGNTTTVTPPAVTSMPSGSTTTVVTTPPAPASSPQRK